MVSAPISGLKIIQRKLNTVLQSVYRKRYTVHGFIAGRSIVTNAEIHKRQKYVFNIDIEEFFPSINFGRVRGVFCKNPYNLPENVATILAKICCFNNTLPQGAPTSPIVSNMICERMDNELRRLSKQHRCYYTRYADDITFSTSVYAFPAALAVVTSDKTQQLHIGNELKAIIEGNGFSINPSKIRLQTRNQRQEVTGVVVNKQTNVRQRYIRQIRAMLHAWEKYGEQKAQEEFIERYDHKNRSQFKSQYSFRQTLRGKIDFLAMVRGDNDSYYKKFRKQLSILAPDMVWNKRINKTPKVFVITEGKTDWKHLKAAFFRLKSQSLFKDFDIEFDEYEDKEMGSKQLLKHCKLMADNRHNLITICIFDRDEDDIIEEISSSDNSYKYFGGNVFAFVIPIPEHRLETPKICIELYYSDPDVMRVDDKGKRLFLNTEFSEISGKHTTITSVNCLDMNKVKSRHQKTKSRNLTVVDDLVFGENDTLLTLSKNHFAQNILNAKEGFSDLDISSFTNIFDVISEIIKQNHKEE